MDEAMCSVDDHTVVSHEAQREMFCKEISNIKFKSICCYWFF